MITMVLGGLWHGASWNFVLWGLYQGVVLCCYRAIQGDRSHDRDSDRSFSWTRPVGFLLSLGIFFTLTCYGWLLFRASSLDQVFTFTRTLLLDFGHRATARRSQPSRPCLGCRS